MCAAPTLSHCRREERCRADGVQDQQSAGARGVLPVRGRADHLNPLRELNRDPYTHTNALHFQEAREGGGGMEPTCPQQERNSLQKKRHCYITLARLDTSGNR